MVPPQGDLRADLVRAPVLTLFLVVLAALAGTQMAFPIFPGSASVLLPLTCLTYALPQMGFVMIKATCITIHLFIPALWHGALSLQKGASPTFSADTPAVVWISACVAWGFLNLLYFTASLPVYATRMAAWLACQSVRLVSHGTAQALRHVLSVLTFFLFI